MCIRRGICHVVRCATSRCAIKGGDDAHDAMPSCGVVAEITQVVAEITQVVAEITQVVAEMLHPRYMLHR